MCVNSNDVWHVFPKTWRDVSVRSANQTKHSQRFTGLILNSVACFHRDKNTNSSFIIPNERERERSVAAALRLSVLCCTFPGEHSCSAALFSPWDHSQLHREPKSGSPLPPPLPPPPFLQIAAGGCNWIKEEALSFGPVDAVRKMDVVHRSWYLLVFFNWSLI